MGLMGEAGGMFKPEKKKQYDPNALEDYSEDEEEGLSSIFGKWANSQMSGSKKKRFVEVE